MAEKMFRRLKPATAMRLEPLFQVLLKWTGTVVKVVEEATAAPNKRKRSPTTAKSSFTMRMTFAGLLYDGSAVSASGHDSGRDVKYQIATDRLSELSATPREVVFVERFADGGCRRSTFTQVDAAKAIYTGKPARTRKQRMKSELGRLRYRDRPAANKYSVSMAWKRLQRWFRAHLPPAEEKDPAPAALTELRKFERTIGQKLPLDVVQSFRIYDGQFAGTGIAYGIRVDPLRFSLIQRRQLVKIFPPDKQEEENDDEADRGSFPAGYVRLLRFDPGWIPLMSDGGGNFIGVDLNPGPKGTRGQVILFGRDERLHPVLALSWGQFLTDLADELEAGNFVLNLTEPKYPELTPADPHTGHLHNIGKKWSRAKLGLRKLSAENQSLWDDNYR